MDLDRVDEDRDDEDDANLRGAPGSPARRTSWRRIVGVVLPVAAFAVAAPFAVNGVASALNGVVPDQITTAEVAGPDGASAPTAIGAQVAASPGVESTITEPRESGAETETETETEIETETETEAEAEAETKAETAIETAGATGATVEIVGLADDADDRTISIATEIVAGSGADASLPTETAASAPTAATDEGEANHAHGAVTPEVALTRSERSVLATELSVARDSAMSFATVADAEAGGYKLVTGYLPLIGAHYINWSLMDGTFDPAAPEMLLYDGTESTSNIVGLSYYTFAESEPSPFTGGNDHWHQHIGLCIKDGVVVGGSNTTPEQCTQRGGAKAGATNGWMVHAWVVPGWDSPQGVFSPEHPGLTAELPTS